MANIRVLIVEEVLVISDYLRASLQGSGYEVIGTPRSIEEAVKSFCDSKPDVIIVDTQLGGQPEMAQAARTIRTEFQSAVPIVFLTSIGVDASQPRQSEPCVRKPFSERDLHAAIEHALGNRGGACNET